MWNIKQGFSGSPCVCFLVSVTIQIRIYRVAIVIYNSLSCCIFLCMVFSEIAQNLIIINELFKLFGFLYYIWGFWWQYYNVMLSMRCRVALGWRRSRLTVSTSLSGRPTLCAQSLGLQICITVRTQTLNTAPRTTSLPWSQPCQNWWEHGLLNLLSL